MDWELVDLSVFFMMEFSELLLTGGLLLLLFSCSCLGTLGGLAAGLLSGETDRCLLLVRREERDNQIFETKKTVLLVPPGLARPRC